MSLILDLSLIPYGIEGVSRLLHLIWSNLLIFISLTTVIFAVWQIEELSFVEVDYLDYMNYVVDRFYGPLPSSWADEDSSNSYKSFYTFRIQHGLPCMSFSHGDFLVNYLTDCKNNLHKTWYRSWSNDQRS